MKFLACFDIEKNMTKDEFQNWIKFEIHLNSYLSNFGYTNECSNEKVGKLFDQWENNKHKFIEHICNAQDVDHNQLPILIYKTKKYLCTDGIIRPALCLTALTEYSKCDYVAKELYGILNQFYKTNDDIGYSYIRYHHSESCEDRNPFLPDLWLMHAVITFDFNLPKQQTNIFTKSIASIKQAIKKLFSLMR